MAVEATLDAPPSPPPKTETGKSEAEEMEYLTGLKLIAMMTAITLVGFLMLLDASIVSTAIPSITTTFHSLDDVGWYGSAYLLSSCSLQPLSGKMYTYFNTKWTFLGFFTVFEIGSALCGAATSSTMLIIGRACAGVGASGLLNGAYTIAQFSVAPTLTGILMGLSQFGLMSGPLVGGALTQYASWRWCFYINLPCAAVVGPLLMLVTVPEGRGLETRNQTLATSLRKMDLPGFVIFAASSIQVLIALNWGGTTYRWDSGVIIGLFCGSGAALIIFLIWEYFVGAEAMIPFSLIRRQAIWASCINYGTLTGSMLTSTFYLPLYFQAVRNATPTMSGVDLLPSILGNMLFAMATGVLGYYLPFAVASGAFHAAGTGALITLTPTTTTAHWVAFQLLQGIGRGLGIQMPIVAVQNNTAREYISIATALVVFAQNFGGAVFLSLARVVFTTGLRSNLAIYAPDSNADGIVAAGATAIRETVRVEELSGVLVAYSKALNEVFYLGTAAAGVALVVAFGMGWANIKKSSKEGSS